MTDCLGIGGQSITIRKTHGQYVKAFKIIPLDDESEETKNRIRSCFENIGKITNVRPVRADELYPEPPTKRLKMGMKRWEPLQDQPEYICSSISHENVIRYENVSVDLVNDEPCLIIGTVFVNVILYSIVNFTILMFFFEIDMYSGFAIKNN